MSEPQEATFYSNEVFGFDDVQGFDAEVILCPEGIDAELAPGKLTLEPIESLTEFSDTRLLPESDDPDRPAA